MDISDKISTTLSDAVTKDADCTFMLKMYNGDLMVIHRWKNRYHLEDIEEDCPFCRDNAYPLVGLYRRGEIVDDGEGV